MISIQRSTRLISHFSSRRTIASTNMIRRKISTGVLRATKSSSSLRSTALNQAATPVSQQQTAGLASATLLSSQRNWAKETVPTLKGELKKRGLSQTGNKSILVDRLKSSDTSDLLPPMPSVSSTSAQASSFARQLSTSATASASKRSSSKSQPQPPSATSFSDDTITSTGPEVVSQRTDAPKTIQPTPAEVSIAPGLPATKATEAPKKDTLQVELPTPDEKPEPPINIPIVPDNFRAPSEDVKETSSTFTPKVVTVASPGTHIGGGPTHALHEAVDPYTLEQAEEAVESGIKSLSATISSALGAPARAIKSADIASGLPTIGSPTGFADAKEKYEPSGKKLDSDERRGLWVLGGIVGFGLLFGGSKKKKDQSHGDDHSTKAAGGVKGDAAWEKASGAGVVGHGKRKD